MKKEMASIFSLQIFILKVSRLFPFSYHFCGYFYENLKVVHFRYSKHTFFNILSSHTINSFTTELLACGLNSVGQWPYVSVLLACNLNSVGQWPYVSVLLARGLNSVSQWTYVSVSLACGLNSVGQLPYEYLRGKRA